MKITRACLFIDDFNRPSDELIGRVSGSAARAGVRLGPAGCCAESLSGSGLPGCDSCEAGLILGGDGTILRGFGYFMDREIPSFGINTGHLGYLASAEIDEIDAAMTALATDGSILERLPVLRAAMPGGAVLTAVNDISVNRSISGGMLHLDVRTHDETIASVAGDGIVVSTPLGSTAYAMSAGGPILDPRIPAILMVALCAHQISLRPIVFSAGTALAVGVGQVRGEGPVVCADGRPCGVLQQGETVTVTYHPGCCPVLRMRSGDGFYARLGRKFGWGARG